MVRGLKTLWKRTFGDPDRYIDLFFTRRFDPSQVMTVCEGERVLSMLFLLPLTVTAGERSFSARYLYAVATDPDARGRGLSTGLLEQAHERLRAEGVEICLLQPAAPSLFDFYAARGWKTEFYLNTEEVIPRRDAAVRSVKLYRSSMREVMTLRNRYFSGEGLFARWDAAALEYQDSEADLTGAQVIAFTGVTPGYAFCQPTEDGVLIKELVSPDGEPVVLDAIAEYFGAKRLLVRQRAKTWADAVGFGMTYWYCTPPQLSDAVEPGYLSLGLD